MKQVVISISSLFSGIILLCTLIFIANDQSKYFNSWATEYGKFWSAAKELHIMQLFYFSFALIFIGMLSSVYIFFNDKNKI